MNYSKIHVKCLKKAYNTFINYLNQSIYIIEFKLKVKFHKLEKI